MMLAEASTNGEGRKVGGLSVGFGEVGLAALEHPITKSNSLTSSTCMNLYQRYQRSRSEFTHATAEAYSGAKGQISSYPKDTFNIKKILCSIHHILLLHSCSEI